MKRKTTIMNLTQRPNKLFTTYEEEDYITVYLNFDLLTQRTGVRSHKQIVCK